MSKGVGVGGLMGGQFMSQRTGILGLRLWEIVALGVAAFTVLILFLLSLRLHLHALARSKSKKQQQLIFSSYAHSTSIPEVSKIIKEVHSGNSSHNVQVEQQPPLYYKLPSSVGSSARRHSVDILDDEKEVVTFAYATDTQVQPNFQSVRRKKLAAVEVKEELVHVIDVDTNCNEANSSERNPPTHEGANAVITAFTAAEVGASTDSSSTDVDVVSSRGVDEQQCAGWGEWYSVEELEKATKQWAESNIVGKGGYGIVYRGLLPDASVVAVKHLLNVSREQAEKEFRVEVEAIGRVRHKNLVGLLGYCAEGPHRILIYEYVDNGNLDQWLHGPLEASRPIPWNARMNILLGTAKGLAYLHEDLEPKVVHRDVKASNILLDCSWNAKVSDFGLAKLLGAGMSHVATRVMGTFGYVAPEYASTGLLTESSDVYSFGVLMMEVITGRNPVDHSRPAGEMNLVEWSKRMVASKRWEEVVDPQLSSHEAPSGRALKRALLVALRCVDPDALHRPRMGHVVYMLEADDLSFHHLHVCKHSRGREVASFKSFGPVNNPDQLKLEI